MTPDDNLQLDFSAGLDSMGGVTESPFFNNTLATVDSFVIESAIPDVAVECDSTILVDIDIKPGSDPNSINLCSNGGVPVAILGSETFNVYAVKTETLRFAEASVKVVGKKDPHELCSFEDVNGDVFNDLVCKYVTTDIAGVDGESTTATVNGELMDTTPFEGTDSVNIVKDTCS